MPKPKIKKIGLYIIYFDGKDNIIQKDAGAVLAKDGIEALDQLYSKAKQEVEQKLGTS